MTWRTIEQLDCRGGPRFLHGQRHARARLAANPLGQALQRQALRALAVDLEDAIAGADAFTKAGLPASGLSTRSCLLRGSIAGRMPMPTISWSRSCSKPVFSSTGMYLE